jgi:hypothetical protein
MTDSRSKREAELYEAAQGRPPSRLPDDHPDAWQWAYRGGKAEYEERMGELGLLAQTGAPVKIDGQEELFS